jgi:hypothetical protein
VPGVLRQLLAIIDETREQKPDQSPANAAWQP